MKVLNEKPWSHVLIEKEDTWILTVMINVGHVEIDRSFILLNEEIEHIKKDESFLDKILVNIRQNTQHFEDREVKPAVWP